MPYGLLREEWGPTKHEFAKERDIKIRNGEIAMELKDTVEMMGSADYKERFKAEYYQTKIRYEKLKAFNNKIEAANADSRLEMPKHDCPDWMLRNQQHTMGEYLHILEVRAVIEGIEL